MPVRSRGASGASLFALCGPRFRAQSILRGAQSPVRDFQEFSCCRFAAGSLLCDVALLLASSLRSQRAGQGSRVSTRRRQLRSAALVCGAQPFRIAAAISPDLGAAPRDEATAYRQAIPTLDPALLHSSASGGCSVKPAGAPDQFLVLIPAFNEVGAIAGVIREVRGVVPGAPILVVDDASTDGTDRSARAAGASVLRLPYHLGLGGVVQAGYKLAFELGYEYVIRVDGDGQHDPKYIPALLERLRATGCHMVIGSRFQNGNGAYTSSVRAIGIWFFRLVLRPILGKPVSDPTSGFVGVNRQALRVFTGSFPLEYPEIEALVVLQRKRFQFQEVPVGMRPRKTGRSTITAVKSLYYIFHVLLGVFINVLKFEGRRRKDTPQE